MIAVWLARGNAWMSSLAIVPHPDDDSPRIVCPDRIAADLSGSAVALPATRSLAGCPAPAPPPGLPRILRPYQLEAVERTIDYMSADPAKRKGWRPVVVLPTASGKSLVIAELVRRAIERDKRVLMLTHRAELVQQNVEEFELVSGGTIPFGIYSASLNNKDLSGRATFAGVQSLVRLEDIPYFPLVIVDEAHWVPPLEFGDGDKSQYQQVFAAIMAQGPMILAGFTASPFRLGSGYIWEGEDRVFDGVSYEADMSTLESQGDLSPLLPYDVGEASLDTSKVRVRAGEFVESELEKLTEESAEVIAADIVARANRSNRQSVKVFVPGVRMAHAFAALLRDRDPGAGVDLILGDTGRDERDRTLDSFRNARSRYLVSCAVLTTGLNVPRMDAIALVRATKSPALYVQMCGRGSRLFPGKRDCLIWDYGENVVRHGPVNCVRPRKGNGKGEVDPPGKFCAVCATANPRGQDSCVGCGEPFPPPQERFGPDVTLAPGRMSIVDGEARQIRWRKLTQVTAEDHFSRGREPVSSDQLPRAKTAPARARGGIGVRATADPSPARDLHHPHRMSGPGQHRAGDRTRCGTARTASTAWACSSKMGTGASTRCASGRIGGRRLTPTRPWPPERRLALSRRWRRGRLGADRRPARVRPDPGRRPHSHRLPSSSCSHTPIAILASSASCVLSISTFPLPSSRSWSRSIISSRVTPSFCRASAAGCLCSSALAPCGPRTLSSFAPFTVCDLLVLARSVCMDCTLCAGMRAWPRILAMLISLRYKSSSVA